MTHLQAGVLVVEVGIIAFVALFGGYLPGRRPPG